MKNNTLENLELKLAQTRLENSEKLDKIENEYKKKYSDFLSELFKNDNLGFKRFVSVNFQLDKLDNPEKEDKEIFKKSIKQSIENIPLENQKKEILELKILKLEKNKEKIKNLFIDNLDIHKDKNFPILESLKKYGNINDDDLLNISLKFKETKNFLSSILVLDKNKIDLIKSNYFELNNTKSEDRIENFKNDFSEEIEKSENLKIYPKIIKFIGKNYFKLRVKNKIEGKKDRLRRLFKIAFLKLYKLKYSGIDIGYVLNKIDTLDDLESMINILLKFFEQLKQNPNLQKDYIISDEVDEIEEIGIEAEENKEKMLFGEEKIKEVTEILEKNDKFLEEASLNELLGDDVDLIGKKFIKRQNIIINSSIKNLEQNSGIYNENDENNEDDEDELEKEKIINLEEYYEDLKKELEELELKKKKLFLNGEYDLLDEINNELLEILVKLKKVSKLLGIDEEDL